MPHTMMVHSPLELIAYPCGAGAQDAGCADGAHALVAGGLLTKLASRGMLARPHRASFSASGDMYSALSSPLDRVIQYGKRLADDVFDSLDAGFFPVMLGGDHSMAAASWNAVAKFYHAREKLGLVWIDAHLDAHTPDTSHSSALHGMPLAMLLGYGDEKWLRAMGGFPAISPQHVSVIGVRSFEEEEAAFLESKNVRIYSMDEVRRRGFSNVLSEAYERANSGTKGVGLTIDLDAVDPTDAPGVGSPEPGGISGKELIGGLAMLSSLPAFSSLRALEIAEYNPHMDVHNRTGALVAEIIYSTLQPGAQDDGKKRPWNAASHELHA